MAQELRAAAQRLMAMEDDGDAESCAAMADSLARMYELGQQTLADEPDARHTLLQTFVVPSDLAGQPSAE